MGVIQTTYVRPGMILQVGSNLKLRLKNANPTIQGVFIPYKVGPYQPCYK